MQYNNQRKRGPNWFTVHKIILHINSFSAPTSNLQIQFSVFLQYSPPWNFPTTILFCRNPMISAFTLLPRLLAPIGMVVLRTAAPSRVYLSRPAKSYTSRMNMCFQWWWSNFEFYLVYFFPYIEYRDYKIIKIFSMKFFFKVEIIFNSSELYDDHVEYKHNERK